MKIDKEKKNNKSKDSKKNKFIDTPKVKRPYSNPYSISHG